jgi:hypothetical protein
VLPVHNARDHRGQKGQEGQDYTVVGSSSQNRLSELPGNNPKYESSNNHSHGNMSGWGVDWMGVANGSKNLVEKLDHASSPASIEVRRLTCTYVIKFQNLQSISFYLYPVKGKSKQEFP